MSDTIPPLRVLDLFSGIGGFSLGLERTGGFETVAFCEIDEFPRLVLAKHWPDVPIHNDVRELIADEVGPIDVIVGGYPCQPFSCAGERRGEEDDRHLWPEMHRLVAALRPAWVIAENVAGHISMGLDRVLSDLEGEGYACRPLVLPACAVDAPHRRDRLWIVANASGGRCRRSRGGEVEQSRGTEAERTSKTVANDGRGGRQGPGHEISRGEITARWLPEPSVGRMADGVPDRMDRLRALGNAVVPQIPEMIGHAILAAEVEHHKTECAS